MEWQPRFILALTVDDVINIVGSLLLGIVLIGAVLAFLVLLKNRGSRPSPVLEAPGLPPTGFSASREASNKPVLHPNEPGMLPVNQEVPTGEEK